MPERALDPVVYGSPGQIEVLMESVARLLEHEPDTVFHDSGVQGAARRLAGVIHQRVDGERAS